MKKVILGLSGGVDSSVAAILLKEKGYEVIGITFKFIDDFDATDAINVAKKIGIEHHVIDYRDVFKEKVIDKLIEDYKNGITPNPCVTCNKNVKLKFLYDQMEKYNASYIATGHYAKIEDGNLYKSADNNKDQTYFLCQMTKEELSKLILPLEGIEKSYVREIARKYNLDNADKKDSLDVCFINKKFGDFISDHIKDKECDIVDINTNKVIGKQKSLSKFTIGQRRGLDIGGLDGRCYVVGKNIKDNILYVAIGDNTDALISDSCLVCDVNLFNDSKIEKCKAKFRSRQEEIDVEVEYLDDNKMIVKYQGVKSVTPGQACVLYKDNLCLGGGIIKEVRKNGEKLWYL